MLFSSICREEGLRIIDAVFLASSCSPITPYLLQKTLPFNAQFNLIQNNDVKNHVEALWEVRLTLATHEVE